MDYILMDLEWNCPYSKVVTKNQTDIDCEIVQIGAVKVDEKFEIIDTFKIMVMPKYYPKMHKKVANLTGIQTDDLQYGFPFKKAFSYFSKWCGDDFIFLTWGPDDIYTLAKNMGVYKLDAKWIPPSYDIQMISKVQTAQKGRTSLINAVNHFEKTPYSNHDALNDAKNVAIICRFLDIPNAIEKYDELTMGINNESLIREKMIKKYESRTEMLEAFEINHFTYNGVENSVCGKWVKQNTYKYITIAMGADIRFFVRLRLKREKNGRFSVKRIVYLLNEERWHYYCDHIKGPERENIIKKSYKAIKWYLKNCN